MDLVYNFTNASKVLGVPITEIRKIEVWENCVYICGKGFSKFVSKGKFLQQFVESRKERAKSIVVEKVSQNKYIAFNTENNNRYTVELLGGEIICSCKDYKKQVAEFGKGACKHIYAVIEGEKENGNNSST